MQQEPNRVLVKVIRFILVCPYVLTIERRLACDEPTIPFLTQALVVNVAHPWRTVAGHQELNPVDLARSSKLTDSFHDCNLTTGMKRQIDDRHDVSTEQNTSKQAMSVIHFLDTLLCSSYVVEGKQARSRCQDVLPVSRRGVCREVPKASCLRCPVRLCALTNSSSFLYFSSPVIESSSIHTSAERLQRRQESQGIALKDVENGGNGLQEPNFFVTKKAHRGDEEKSHLRQSLES
jgi:hypothetical protein